MKPTFKNIASVSACVWLGFTGLIPVTAQSLDLIEGFEGIVTSSTFPDPVIAAGPASVVVMVNAQIAIYEKQGDKLFQQNLGGSQGFWKAQNASLVAEPWIIFDPNSGRFIASAAEFGNAKGMLYLAISKNATPLSSGDWHKYKLDRSGLHQGPGFAGVPTYPDDAKVGVDGDAIYVTSTHFAKNQNITGTFSHSEMFGIEKTALLAGGPINLVHNEPIIPKNAASTIFPAIVFEPAPAMYFAETLTRLPDDEVRIHTLVGQTRTVSPVPVAAFDRPPDVPQPGTGNLLENIDARLMSAVVRDGSLWTAHAIEDPAVDAESLARWYQFDVVSTPGVVALAQIGNVDPGPALHAWLPRISVDVEGNMALGLSVGGANQFASIGYTGQLVTDLPGATLPVHIARYGEGSYEQYAWGEYSGLAIDPDGYTFWQFNEYPTAAHGWRTYVSAFQVAPPPPPPNPLHCGDLDGSSANSGKNWKATVVVTIHDGNDNPVPDATVSIQWSGGFSGTALPRTTDSNGRCTFVSGNISKTSPSATLTILNMTHLSLTYTSGENHDPDGDSSGTTLTVLKP